MKESGALVGVLASAEFHAAVIRDGHGAIDPGRFRAIEVRVKETRPNLDMHAIVRTCLDFPGGLEEFLAVVRAFAGDSSRMRDLDDAIAQITRRRD